eukprot:scaffold4887_cov69-Phaeocystis_antarctica.AAC.3
MQEACQVCCKSRLTVGSAAYTNFHVRAVTAQLSGEVGAVEVAHTLLVVTFGYPAHGHEHARGARQRG